MRENTISSSASCLRARTRLNHTTLLLSIHIQLLIEPSVRILKSHHYVYFCPHIHLHNTVRSTLAPRALNRSKTKAYGNSTIFFTSYQSQMGALHSVVHQQESSYFLLFSRKASQSLAIKGDESCPVPTLQDNAVRYYHPATSIARIRYSHGVT
jgi:hypothetical protein